ncbi:hypothetical protein KKF91_18705 [Myxococcota bacterium]|nr:hypothetical protein [Myxococcota bacterium]
MRTLALWINCLLISGAIASPRQLTPPEVAAPPEVLLAQRGGAPDDSDLRDEKTLDELMQDEYDDKKQSASAAIGLSLIPGGGFGLMYADKKAQSIVPILFSIVGYSVAGYYMLGLADTSSEDACIHTRDGKVNIAECSYNRVAPDPTLPEGTVTSHSADPRADGNKAYYETVGDYTMTVLGEDFDGTKLGLTILAGTYAATTILGALWSASAVSNYNERLWKDIESTTRATPPQPTIKPMIAYDGERGLFGARVEF